MRIGIPGASGEGGANFFFILAQHRLKTSNTSPLPEPNATRENG